MKVHALIENIDLQGCVRLPIRIENPTPLLPFTVAFSDGEMGDYVQYLFLSI